MTKVPTVTSIEDIKTNLRYLDKLIKNPPNQAHLESYKSDIIYRAKHFIRYKTESNEIAFAPSRFVGYKEYSMSMYLKKTENGTEASNAIGRVLKSELNPAPEIELEFIKFCNGLGLKETKRKRKFWDISQLQT